MRHCWQIGIVNFHAGSVGDRWLVEGTICQCGVPTIVIEEQYQEGPIERIMDWSTHRVMDFARDLHTEAVNFNPSDNL